MYFLLDITPNKNGDIYKICKHIKGRRDALNMIHEYCLNYIFDEAGKSNANRDIIIVDNLSNIKEPNENGYYMYSLTTNPDKLYLYKKSMTINGGYIYNTYSYNFKCIKSFELIQYELELPVSRNDPTPMTTKNGRTLPMMMTQSPYPELLTELKNSSVFRKNYIE